MEGASPFMCVFCIPARLPGTARRAVILTPSRSSHPTQLLSCKQVTPVSPLAATLMDLPASVANKRLTRLLSPLAATLTKNRGEGGTLLLTRNLKKDFYSEVSAAADNGGPASSLPKKSRSSLRLSTFRPSDVRTFKRPPKTAGCVPTLPNLKLAPPPTSPQISFPPSHPLESPHCTNERACTHRNEARA